jgi:arginyl-tRNA synthetase
VRDFATEAMMDMIRADLAALGVTMDVYFSEKSLYGTGRIEAALDSLTQKGLIYQGVLEPPKGKLPEDWEAREQTLFRSTAHGDDVDRPVRKSDGSWTYFAPDIAYHFDKIERGFDLLIDVLGADHGGYVKRMKAAVAALSDGRVPLEVKLVQLVRLYKGGEPFKMSKRAGTFVTLREVVDQVGADVTRFVMLTRKNDAPLDFDFDKVLEQSKDNPVFYVQYAHARICSVLRKADEAGIACADARSGSGRPVGAFPRGGAGAGARLAQWPRVVEVAARAGEPHRIATYLAEPPPNSTGCGIAATTNPPCASCRRLRPTRRAPKSPLPGPPALSFPQVLVSLAWFRSRKCADHKARPSGQSSHLSRAAFGCRGSEAGHDGQAP